MKLFNKTDSPFLSRHEWRKVFTAVSIITLLLYTAAMICSLNGIDIFIIKYQNEQMDRIESFLSSHGIYPMAMWLLSTIEFSLIMTFCIKRRIPFYYVIPYYAIRIILAFIVNLPDYASNIYTVLFYLLALFVETIIKNKKIVWKDFGIMLLMLLIAQAISLLLQLMIYVIKSGYFSTENHVMNLSAMFIYSLEYDIALSVLLFTVSLYIDKGKGDSKSWTTYQVHSGSSQTSKTTSQRLSWKNLTKKQKNKLIWLYVRLYLVQILGFTIIMILPFLTGKVLEFLIMYLAFAVVRYILGFKYSLHFKSETLCISVGAVVFGILTLAVPFFYIDLIIAILLGSGLAIFLHLSYKYRGFWLFAKMARPDKFAALYAIFEGNLSERYILRTCKYKGLSVTDAYLVLDYMNCEKLSYLSYKYNYSVKTLDRKLTDAIDILNK